MTKIDDFRLKWNEIRSAQGYFQRLDPQHPLDFFVGIDQDGCEELMLLSDFEPSKMKSSKSIRVEKGQREDSRWAVQIILIAPEREDVFARLCCDLVESSAESTDKLQGLETVIARFITWQKLMEAESEGLSNEKIKGIIGELKYAELFLLPRYGKDVVIESWLGPEGADRDFVFKDTWTEVKAVGTGKLTVDISSLNQLETDIIGTLAICFIDSTSETDNHGFSFASVIDNFRNILGASPRALSIFERRLANLGYIDRKEYAEKYYVMSVFHHYRIDSTFPKLTTKDVRPEIVRAKYELLISALSTWELSEA